MTYEIKHLKEQRFKLEKSISEMVKQFHKENPNVELSINVSCDYSKTTDGFLKELEKINCQVKVSI